MNLPLLRGSLFKEEIHTCDLVWYLNFLFGESWCLHLVYSIFNSLRFSITMSRVNLFHKWLTQITKTTFKNSFIWESKNWYSSTEWECHNHLQINKKAVTEISSWSGRQILCQNEVRESARIFEIFCNGRATNCIKFSNWEGILRYMRWKDENKKLLWLWTCHFQTNQVIELKH